MTRELVIGTSNPDKRSELAQLLAELPFVLLPAGALTLPEVVEDAPTLEGNAAKKATEIAAATGRLTLADDTGLEVDALDGAPGVLSARYAGPECDYAANNARLLAELAGVPEDGRGARFVTVVACAEPGRLLFCVRGECAGRILEAPRGAGGFGYDPLFWVPELARTYAELSADEKHAVSHRGRALRAARERLEAL